MKTSSTPLVPLRPQTFHRDLPRRAMSRLLFLGAFLLAHATHAGFTLEMNVVRYDQYGYYFAPNLVTNDAPPAVPLGSYFIASSGYPTNGSWAAYQFTTSGFNWLGSGTWGYGDYASMLQALTNGTWSILVTNTATTNGYHFTVTAGISSNDLPPVQILFPANGATNVPAQPVFYWQGPTNYNDLIVYEPSDSAYLPVTQTNWSGIELSQGINSFTPHYDSYSTTGIICSVPLDGAAQPVSSWVSTTHLQDYASSQFTVGAPDTSGTAHMLVAHYPFDATSGAALDAGEDSYTNGFNMSFGIGWGASGGANPVADSAAGAGAMQFHDGDGSSGGGLGWTDPTPAPLLSAVAGSFSISCWVKTTQSIAWDQAAADSGAGIVAANVFGQANDVIPLALTGSKIGFLTGGPSGDATLNSSAQVNDGVYHHVVVTRNQATGQKIIYIDGAFDSFSSGTAGLLSAPQKLTIGALADAGNPDPDDGSYYNGYDGELDDLQIYAGVLSADEAADLYNNPGLTEPDVAPHDFNAALGTAGLNWSTSGDANWFLETTNAFAPSTLAAQSGPVTDNESSTLSVTINGPGTVSFAWSSIANAVNSGFYCEFDVDGSFGNDLSGDTDWYQDGPYNLGDGPHVLTWTAFANGDSDPTEAAFLDQVIFITNIPPAITLNPFDQTNYPGYSVALLAGATGSPPPAWQWYKVGNSSPITDATNALYLPGASGTATVAGSYYAVASCVAGSAITTTAAVSFVSAPLPPDWTAVTRSPFDNNNLPTSEGFVTSLGDAAGDIYAGGFMYGTNSFGTTNFICPNGTYCGDVVKYTAAGAALWAVAVTNNGNGDAEVEGLAAAPDNGLYVVGNYLGTNWLGTNRFTDLTIGSYRMSIFLARLDANGNPLWVRTITGTNFCFTEFHEVVADAAGHVTLSGLLNGWTSLSSSTPATGTNLFADGQQGLLAQYDANGTLQWAEITTNWLVEMVCDGGRIYGTFGNNSPSVGFAGLTLLTDRSKVIAALNETNGSGIWLQGIGAALGQINRLNVVDDDAVIAAAGTNLFIAGTAEGSDAAFWPFQISWSGYAHQYLARCDTNGTPQFLTTFGSSTTMPWAIQAAPGGNVYVAGDFDTYSFFGNDLIAGAHLDSIGTGYFGDAFLAKFDIHGNPLWARTAVAENNLVNFRDLTLAADGVWTCGVIKARVDFAPVQVWSALSCYGAPCPLTFYESGVLAKIADNVAVPQPVFLSNVEMAGSNFQFSFLSQSGFGHSVQYRTNLVTGTDWQVYTVVAGDGTWKTIPVPLSVFGQAKQGFVRVSTQ